MAKKKKEVVTNIYPGDWDLPEEHNSKDAGPAGKKEKKKTKKVSKGKGVWPANQSMVYESFYKFIKSTKLLGLMYVCVDLFIYQTEMLSNKATDVHVSYS